MKPVAWYDPSNGMVSTDKDSPLFTPLGQVWGLYLKEEASMTQTEALRLALEALEKLWNIIDDIDTYSDMAKADEKLYRSLVERRQRQRFEETGISTDGYELHGGAITAIKAALEAKVVQVSPLEFVEMVMEKEHLVGNPIFWAEWPNKDKNT